MLLFVYGSLRKGLPNHYLLTNSEYLGQYLTTDRYVMMGTTSKSFPYIFKDETLDTVSTQITGELYNVDNDIVSRLDNLENHPYTYTRHNIYLCNYKEPVIAYITDNYELIASIKDSQRFIIVEDGDWAKFCNHT